MAHILLAEDDRSMCGFLTLALQKAGHSVTVTHDGLAALQVLQDETPDAPFDLLLADIVMPGMDGIELSQKVSRLRPDIKVMFITGFAAVALGREDFHPEKSKILSKPFHLNDLVVQVETLLAA
ncbi:MAG: response regulator [Alphaproteobacteria bacterium]|nr:response regulator [Alphaproteobacteria bacterium]